MPQSEEEKVPEQNSIPRLLRVRLGEPELAVDLVLLEQLAERLRGALREIVREKTGPGQVQVRLLVRNASKGSIVLDVEPQFLGAEMPDAAQVAGTLIDDINSLADSTARPDMSANLLNQYREIVRISQRAGRLQIGYDEKSLVIGRENEILFESAIKEHIEAGAQIVGGIETVNIHSKPWTFGLYTKLDRQRVECRFPSELLNGILQLMDTRALVEITGEAKFSPVGITPRTMEIQEAPIALEFDIKRLLAFRRSIDIAENGESAADAIGRIREEATRLA